MSLDLATLDATAQAQLVRRKEISPPELVDAAIARIERVNPGLNAVITPLFDKARAAARSAHLPDGPFRGVPFLLKDLDVLSAGDPYHAGMRFLREHRFVAPHDSFFVQRLRDAGFVIAGKTNTPELGLNVTTEPRAYGPSCNPWNTEYSTGGSSGGAAAAVASGMVPAAHASDGGGSIRIPASECGLFGLKPSRGRVSMGPDYGEYWSGLVISHAVTRSVRDSAAILDILAGYMPGDPYTALPPARPYRDEVGADPGRLRIGVLTSAAGLHPECAAAARAAGTLLQSLGHTVEDAHPAALDEREAMTQHFMVLVTSWVAATLAEWGETIGTPVGPDDVEPTTWAMAELGRACPAPQYIRTVETLQAYTRRMASWWESGFDLLLSPTLAAPPPRLGELLPPPENPLATERALAYVPFTAPFNITGQPAASLPLHWTADGLPVGVQLVAAYGREDLVLRVSAQIEQAQPWASRRPAVHA
jgi:amidase